MFSPRAQWQSGSSALVAAIVTLYLFPLEASILSGTVDHQLTIDFSQSVCINIIVASSDWPDVRINLITGHMTRDPSLVFLFASYNDPANQTSCFPMDGDLLVTSGVAASISGRV
jgi:hypothetical protein